MFQNISSIELDEEIEYDNTEKKWLIKNVLVVFFTKQNIALYITTFMASTVSLRKSSNSVRIEFVCGSV